MREFYTVQNLITFEAALFSKPKDLIFVIWNLIYSILDRYTPMG